MASMSALALDFQIENVTARLACPDTIE